MITVAARCGYAAKGMVYITIGWLAILAVVGIGGQRGGTGNALREIASQPFGGVLISLMAAGLLGYTAWRLVQAIFDAEQKGSDLKGISIRLGYVLSGLIYAAIAFNCVQLLMSTGSGGDASSSHTRTLMSYPGGIAALYVISAGFLGVGLRQIWRGWHHSYEKNWHLEEMSPQQRSVAAHVSRAGLTARGVVFITMAVFLCLAAFHVNPEEARGLGGALRALSQQPFGPWLLGAVAVGLMAYGCYCLVNARFRRVDA